MTSKTIKASFVIFAVLVSFGLAGAQSGDFADYSIVGNDVFVELRFENSSALDVRLPKDAKSIELNTDSYTLENFEEYKLIRLSGSGDVRINYMTNNLIDRAGKSYYFVMKNYLPSSVTTKVLLPESAILSEPSIIFPKEYEITTNGRRVILNFEDFSDKEILVKYEFIGKEDSSYFVLLFVLLIGGVVFYAVRKKTTRSEPEVVKTSTEPVLGEEKTHSDLTRNLFEDEKKIVEFLLEKKNKECWTKEIVKGLEISKVKLSRKLRSLEQKGLIKRIPYGNENIVRLLT